ncbi:MAG TPA: hypothetical protein VFE78_10705 [Gemmataceae bacterium]|jgi:hypothetical protein|nr:hypothetical protein [Gemmataceae bacterium]
MPADAVRPDDRPARQGGIPVWVWLLLGGGLLFGMLLIVGVVATLFATGVIGGGPKLTVENVQRIQGGMTEAEVVAILGRPTETADGAPQGFAPGASEVNKNVGGVNVKFQFGPTTPGLRTLTWRKGKEYITIVFRNGKVASVTDGYLKDGGRFGATK